MQETAAAWGRAEVLTTLRGNRRGEFQLGATSNGPRTFRFPSGSPVPCQKNRYWSYALDSGCLTTLILVSGEPGPRASVTPGGLGEMQNLGPHPDALNQNLHLTRPPGLL